MINAIIKSGYDSEVILIIPIILSITIAFILETMIDKPIMNLVRNRMNYD